MDMVWVVAATLTTTTVESVATHGWRLRGKNGKRETPRHVNEWVNACLDEWMTEWMKEIINKL